MWTPRKPFSSFMCSTAKFIARLRGRFTGRSRFLSITARRVRGFLRFSQGWRSFIIIILFIRDIALFFLEFIHFGSLFGRELFPFVRGVVTSLNFRFGFVPPPVECLPFVEDTFRSSPLPHLA